MTSGDGRTETVDPVGDLFTRVVALPAEELAATLDRECQGDHELPRRVQELLDHFHAPLPILRNLGAGPRAGRGGGPAHSLLPSRIDEFRILERIGHGGMGAVYLAEQDRPRRRVALKVLLPFQADPHSARRLQQEAEVLGRLHHPGIAEVYAAGIYSSDLGEQPYFAWNWSRAWICGSPAVASGSTCRLAADCSPRSPTPSTMLTIAAWCTAT